MASTRRHFLELSAAALVGAGLVPRGLKAEEGDGEEIPEFGSGPASWREVRRLCFELSPEYTYFNCSTLGPTLKPVRKRMEQVQRAFSEGCHLDRFVSEIILSLRPIRETFSRLVNAPPPAGKYIGNVDSVTEGMSLVANGLSFAPGDEILITDHEHTGARTMWELQRDRHGADVRPVPLLDPEDTPATWEENLLSRFRRDLSSGRVKAVSFPWITTSTGHVLPAKDLCALAREFGAASVVDAAQAFAILPIDLVDLDCDFLVVNGHKYLCGPVGSGFLFVNARRLADPSSFWPTVVDETYYAPNDPSRHYPYRKAGVAAYTNILPLQEALLFYEFLGPATVYQRLALIGTWLRRGLGAFPDRFRVITPGGEEQSCVMTCFRMEGGVPSEEVVDRLKEEFAIHCKWSNEGAADAIRLSPHYFTKVAELEGLAKALCRIAGVSHRGWFAAAPLDLLGPW